MAETILIVDDEKELVEILEYNLKREGYATRRAYTGTEALRQAARSPVPDLVLLDLMLPDISGTEVCRQIRAAKATANIPVIMLTAKGEEIDRVVGFEVGADDYVVKPFSVRELALRMKAILRRGKQPVSEPDKAVFGILEIDKTGHRVFVGGAEIVLTAMEFKLLTTFMERKGRVQTRDILLTDVWDIHADVTTRTVDTHIKRLREKLGRAGSYIETIRGVGYRFRSDHTEDDV
jgi:two-component system phosphate regulon response regulator PhoB